MSSIWLSQRKSPFATLRRFARAGKPVERCELCRAELAPSHQHLIELAKRKLVCACDACAILFSNSQGGSQGVPQGWPEGKYRRVPRRIRYLPDFRLTDAQWESLLIPIDMAFFFHSTPENKVVALYPSPAGATESLLALDTWGDIVNENPVLRKMEHDVEALLVNRVNVARKQAVAEYYVAPIDECYKLVGLIRARWHGLSGGSEVWEEIAQFFGDLRKRAVGTGDTFSA